MSNGKGKPGELPVDFVNEADLGDGIEAPVGTPVEGSNVTPIVEPSVDPEVQTEFKHALLQGKKPEDIDRLVASLEAATIEQGKELNRMHSELTAPAIDSAPAEVPSQEEYFNNPGQVIRNEVQAALREAIDPFKKDLAKSTERDIWAKVAAAHPTDFEIARPLIQVYLQKNPGIPVTEESITTLYYTAKGYMQENGVTGAGTSVAPTRNATPPPAPPQHAASSHPIPQANKVASTRALTENERRIARERGFTDEKYLAWLDLTEDEVLTAEMS